MALRGHGAQNFNPRSPCGERPELFPEERRYPAFQSTLPVRGATLALAESDYRGRISIHAPRAGSDALYISKIA